MRFCKLPLILMKITILALFLGGCSTPTATSVPPTPTSPDIKTNTELLVGIWQPLSDNPDAMFIQINSDGTCSHAYLLDRLNNNPEIECTYTFEGSNLLITAIKLNGVQECPSPTARYEIKDLANNHIQLISIKDSCARRIRSTQYEYQRIP